MDKIVRHLADALNKELELEDKGTVLSVDSLKSAIAFRVQELLSSDPSLLFSYLYRLDVSETKLKEALDPSGGDIVKAISKLIYNRQLERVKTKNSYKQSTIDGWDW